MVRTPHARPTTRSQAPSLLDASQDAQPSHEESVPQEQAPRVLPSWYREFSSVFRSGAAHGFLFCGDVHGVTSLQGQSQLRFLQRVLQTDRRDIVLYYHRAVGITFPLESMRAKALELLGPDWNPPPSSEQDAIERALASSGVLPPTGSTSDATDPFSAARSPDLAIAILERLLRAPLARGRVAVLIDGADLICPATSKATMSEERLSLLATLLYWGNDPQLSRQANPICLLVPRLHELHPDLRASDNGYKVIELALPDEQTRLAYITWYLHDHRRADPIPLRDLSLEDLARNTAGLGLRQIEDILLQGALPEEEHDEPIGVSRLLVKSRKDAIIRQQYSDVVVMLDPLPDGFAGLGGMTELIAVTREEVIAPLRAGRLREVPKGILLVGPPGTGKTLYVQAAAKELGFNAVSLQMAKILGGVVGTSEQNLSQVFALARSLAPTFLFIDEIDQTHLAQRGNASGSPVAANLFGALLQFLGDETLRGKVITICATNHPELLDAALLRPGRMDIIFPVLCPNEPARRSILEVQARWQGTTLEPDALTALAWQTERYSAADLEAVLKEARLLARQAGHPGITLADAQAALEHIRPVTLAQVETFTRRALEACNNLRYLPPEYAEQVRQRATSRTHPAPETETRLDTRTARHL